MCLSRQSAQDPEGRLSNLAGNLGTEKPHFPHRIDVTGVKVISINAKMILDAFTIVPPYDESRQIFPGGGNNRVAAPYIQLRTWLLVPMVDVASTLHVSDSIRCTAPGTIKAGVGAAETGESVAQGVMQREGLMNTVSGAETSVPC